MKAVLLMLISLYSLTFGQKTKYDSYYNSYNDEYYSIFVNEYSKNKFYVSISVPTNDAMSDYTYVNFDGKELEFFKKSFMDAKSKFDEWKNISLNNKVQNVDKNMDIDSKRYSYSFTYGDSLYYTNKDKLEFKFLIENYIPYCIFYAKGLGSPNNRYIRTKGFELRFKNTEDFEEFFSKISTDKIQKFLENKAKNESMLN